jgi:hypothetical protein
VQEQYIWGLFGKSPGAMSHTGVYLCRVNPNRVKFGRKLLSSSSRFEWCMVWIISAKILDFHFFADSET